MIDRHETEIALATLIENNQAVTDDMDRLLEEMNRRGARGPSRILKDEKFQRKSKCLKQ